jgi:hypothetical protein
LPVNERTIAAVEIGNDKLIWIGRVLYDFGMLTADEIIPVGIIFDRS